VIVPALSEVALWPFDGTLRDLLARGGIVVTETYPREAYRRLGIAVKRKGERRERAAAAPALLRFAAGIRARLDPALVTAIESGFVSDDDFDAVIGLFGMLDVVRRGRSGEPDDDGVRRVEGWMLGLGSGGPPSGLPSRSDRGGPSYP
jgi:hypothetical protein